MTAIDRAAEVYPDMDEKSPSALTYPPDAVTQFQRGAYLRGWKESRESIDIDVIAAVLNTHRVVGITVGTGKRTARCACSFDFDGDDGRDDFDRHRAAEVKAALLGGERP